MRATIDKAEMNEKNLAVMFISYGHWKITCDYRGKRISTITSNSIAVDDWNSESGETMQNWRKAGRPTNRKLAGYCDLCSEIINKNCDNW